MTFVANLPDGRWRGTQRFTIKAPWIDDDEQVVNFHTSLDTSGRQSGPPHLVNHGRGSLDGREKLVENSWTEEECTRPWWVKRFAVDTGKSEATVDEQLEHEVMGEELPIEEGNVIVSEYIFVNRNRFEPEEIE